MVMAAVMGGAIGVVAVITMDGAEAAAITTPGRAVVMAAGIELINERPPLGGLFFICTRDRLD
jgi:hypothetical protein